MKKKKVVEEVSREYQICGKSLCKIHKVKKISKACYGEKAKNTKTYI